MKFNLKKNWISFSWIGFSVLAILLIVIGLWWKTSFTEQATIRVGVLHSLSGTMAVSEAPLVDAVQLAIEEINSAGGINNQEITAIVADCRSDPDYCAQQAERLITEENVQVLFGCWTSSCRKAVKTVVEKHQHLLVYPLQYEGMEKSAHILYTGAAPNQQIIPGTRWAMEHFGQRLFLVGSDYIFPRTANIIIRDLAHNSSGKIVAEHYLPLGSADVASIIRDIQEKKPDVILNTLNGDSNTHFFSQLVKAGLTDVPIISFSVAESEMLAWGGTHLNQHYGVWSYFQSLANEENRRFVSTFKARFGADRVTSDPIETAYIGVHLWAQAANEAGSTDARYLDPILLQQGIPSPSGVVAINTKTRHLWKMVRVGKVQADGQFKQVYASDAPLRPYPWPIYRTRSTWQNIMQSLP